MIVEEAPDAWGNPGTVCSTRASRSKGDNIIRLIKLRKSKEKSIEEDVGRKMCNGEMELREPMLQGLDIGGKITMRQIPGIVQRGDQGSELRGDGRGNPAAIGTRGCEKRTNCVC